MIALTHGESCLAVHTCNIDVPPPRFVYRSTVCGYQGLTYGARRNMGYSTPQEMMPPPISPSATLRVPGMSPPLSPGAVQYQARERPQTIAYALCDSPVGLLAYILDALRPRLQLPGAQEDPTSPGPTGESSQAFVANVASVSLAVL